MLPLTTDEYVCLRSQGQRAHLYVALFGVYELWVKTRKRDATNERTVNQGDWKPIVNLGPHRLAFVGENVTFDALDSFKITFDNLNGRHHGHGNQDQGYGKGDLGNQQFDWNLYAVPDTDRFDDDPGSPIESRPSQAWDTPQTYTFSTPGLYRLQVREAGGGIFSDPNVYAWRWIRVYQDRNTVDWKVTEVSQLQGSWGDGWKAGLTLRNMLDTSLTDTGLPKFQCIGLYCEDEWWNATNGAWTVSTIGNTRQDPRLVMVGYAVDGSVVVEETEKSVSVNIESIDGQLSRSMSHKLAVWRARGASDPNQKDKKHGTRNDGSGNQVPSPTVQSNNTDTTDASGLNDTWGALLKGFRRVCTTDLATYSLQMRTNALPWHDYYAVWNHDLGSMESAAGEETSVLSNLQTIAKNDWLVACGGHEGAIIYGPDLQVSVDRKIRDGDYLPCWEKNWQIRMEMTEQDIWKATINQALEKKVKYVRLIAENTRKPEKQIVAEKPKNLPRDQPGVWEVEKSLVYDNNDAHQILNHKANAVFQVKNLVYTVQLDLGLNRAIRAGDIIRLTLNQDVLWNAKRFLVKQVGYEIDLEHNTWKTSLQLEECVGQLHTSTLKADCSVQVS